MQHNQQHHPRPTQFLFNLLLDRHRLDHFGDLLQDAINFRRTDADPADVQHAVGTAMEARPALRRELDQVPMGPDTRILTEIGLVESTVVAIADKAERPRRERIGADQLADLRGRLVRRGKCSDVEAKASALGVPAVDREIGVTQDKATNDIRATRYRLQRQVRNMVADPVVLALIENRSGRKYRAQRGKIEGASRSKSRLLAELKIGRVGPEYSHPFGGDNSPQRLRSLNRTVVEHQFGSRG